METKKITETTPGPGKKSTFVATGAAVSRTNKFKHGKTMQDKPTTNNVNLTPSKEVFNANQSVNTTAVDDGRLSNMSFDLSLGPDKNEYMLKQAIMNPNISDEKKDNKLSDVIKDKELIQPLSTNLRLKKEQMAAYIDVIHSTMKQVANAYPKVKEEIMQTVTAEDQKDLALRAISNTLRHILKLISRKDSLQLWQKLHPLFALKLEVTENQAQIEPVSVQDLQEQLFKLDTFYLREHSAVEYALCKLESQKSETSDHFDRLIAQSQQINQQFDVSLVDTSKSMCDNTEKIKASKGKFLDEMQLRFQKLVDAQRKLRFSKQKLLEDLDYQIKEQIHDLTQDTQHKPTPAPIVLEQPKPIKTLAFSNDRAPLLQFFEEPDPVKRAERKEKDLMNMTVRTVTTPLSTSAAGGFKSFYPHTPTGARNLDSIPRPFKDIGVLNQIGDNEEFPFANSENLNRKGHGNEISQRGYPRQAVSENIGPDPIHGGPQSSFNTKIEFEYKPIFIKVISAIWLLVAGRESFIEVFSTSTLRRAQVIEIGGRCISATGSKSHCFIATASKEIHIYAIKTWPFEIYSRKQSF